MRSRIVCKMLLIFSCKQYTSICVLTTMQCLRFLSLHNICIAEEDPVYLCVLPDSDHESCSVDASSESNTVDTTDADRCTVDSTGSKSKTKFLRKEDSGTYYFYDIVHVHIHDQL